jgi:hypothetical protein
LLTNLLSDQLAVNRLSQSISGAAGTSSEVEGTNDRASSD